MFLIPGTFHPKPWSLIVTAIIDRCFLQSTKTRLVVKFCERYGEDVHGAPAAAGLQLPPLLFKSGLRCIHGDGLRRGS